MTLWSGRIWRSFNVGDNQATSTLYPYLLIYYFASRTFVPVSSDSLSDSVSGGFDLSLYFVCLQLNFTQASRECSWGPARPLGDLEFSIGRLGEVSGISAVSWDMTLAASWSVESGAGEAGEVVSSNCSIVGLGRVEKSQGRGTCRIQLVSKAIHR